MSATFRPEHEGSPAGSQTLRCGPFTFDLAHPLVMGVLNVTPDSFSDGGEHATVPAAIVHGRQMIADGAAIVDVGGESTRPGAEAVSEDVELARVVPVVTALAAEGIAVSVDTRKTAVMRAAIAAGAAMINDVTALSADGAIAACAEGGVGVCLMHMRGEPATMQQAPQYADVVAEVGAYLAARVAACIAGGIGRDQIVIDPGFGFGKAQAHNVALLQSIPALAAIGHPVAAGLSRKSMLGRITGRAVDDRLAGSLAAAMAAVANGASIVRVHDVRETVDALAVWQALQNSPDRT